MVTRCIVYYYSAPVWVRSTVINPSVCESVCPRTYLWNRWTDFHDTCVQIPLWLWLGPPLAALRYRVGVMMSMKYE